VIRRRSLLLSVASAPLCLSPISRVLAQSAYPNRQILSVGSFAAGSGADIVTRFYSDKLAAVTGRPIVVEPRVGMGGTIAAASVARAAPDGYTIYVAPSSSVLAAAPSVFRKLSYDPMRDFANVVALFKTAFMFVVPSNSPVRSIADLTELLRQKGAKGSYGSSTLPGKIAGELYKAQFGLATLEVPYKSGASAFNDLASGLLDFYLTDTGTVKAQIGPGGRLRALCVTSQTRVQALPDIPSAGESGLKFDLLAYGSMHVPAQTPRAIIDQLTAWMMPIAASDDAKKFLVNLGYDPWLGGASVVQEMLERETRNWAEYVKIAKVEPQ
jgi:tripartite-type tricarboxylate transporter receptor subunit TctC